MNYSQFKSFILNEFFKITQSEPKSISENTTMVRKTFKARATVEKELSLAEFNPNLPEDQIKKEQLVIFKKKDN
jgi:hypothetical protein